MGRIEKINALMKREISNMIQLGELNDPRLSFVTITQVVVTRDLRSARVSFSVLTNNPADIAAVQQGLDSARGYVRRLIGQRVRMRYTPEINFIHDKSLEYSDQIDRIINEIHTSSEMNQKDK